MFKVNNKDTRTTPLVKCSGNVLGSGNVLEQYHIFAHHKNLTQPKGDSHL